MFETIHDWVNWLGENATLYFLPFLALISVLVFVHEWGHYIVARMCGVKVETFSIGFGKKIWSRRDKSGCDWQVALIPLGGYVKMFGDTDPASATFTESVKEGEEIRAMTAQERSQAFFSKTVAQRAAIVFAGPAINFIFALVVLTALYTSVGRPVTPPIAAGVIVGSAADTAGFKPHDRIVSINGKPVHRFADIQRTVAVLLDTPLTIEVERAGKTITLSDVTPKLDTVKDRFGFSHTRGLLGVVAPSTGLSLDGIEAVQGRTGDIEGRIKRRFGRGDTVLLMKGYGDLPSRGLHVKLDAALNQDFIENGASAKTGLLLAPRLENENLDFGPIAAFREAVNETWFVSVGTLQSLGQMIIGTRSAQELGGLIRIGAVTGDAAQAGWIAFLTLAALLSINLGLINLLPIPMLDGGHLMFYGIEALKGSPVTERIQDYAFRFGFVILIGLMVFANLNDVIQLVK